MSIFDDLFNYLEKTFKIRIKESETEKEMKMSFVEMVRSKG